MIRPNLRPRLLRRVLAAFTLVEILISIMILALGVLGLGVLFPVVIREQRLGVDASTGIVVAGMAKDYLTTPLWGQGLPQEPMTALGNGVPITPGNELAVGACCFGSPVPVCQVTTLKICRDTHGAPAGGAASGAAHAFGPGTTCAAGVCRHPAIAYPAVNQPGTADRGLENATRWMWQVMRNRETFAPFPAPIVANTGGLGAGYVYGSRNFETFGQGEWFAMSDPATGDVKIGYPDVASMGVSTAPIKYGNVNLAVACVTVPVSERLYPQSPSIEPQFVWDFAVQRVPRFKFDGVLSPDDDAIRAVIFVRRIDPRIRLTGAATSIRDAITNATLPATDRRMAVGVDAYGNPSFDGTGDYSGIVRTEVELWYSSRDTDPAALHHADRLYMPQQTVSPVSAQSLKIRWGQMKQPGQKLVDNMGNIYTVVGSGNEANPGPISAQDIDGDTFPDYITIDRPVPIADSRASNATNGSLGTGYGANNGGGVRRALWCVGYTPQIPVAVTTVDLIKGGF